MSCQLPRLGDWWLGTQNCGAQLKVSRALCHAECLPLTFRENRVWLLDTTMCNRRQESLLPKLVTLVALPLQDL